MAITASGLPREIREAVAPIVCRGTRSNNPIRQRRCAQLRSRVICEQIHPHQWCSAVFTVADSPVLYFERYILSVQNERRRLDQPLGMVSVPSMVLDEIFAESFLDDLLFVQIHLHRTLRRKPMLRLAACVESSQTPAALPTFVPVASWWSA